LARQGSLSFKRIEESINGKTAAEADAQTREPRAIYISRI